MFGFANMNRQSALRVEYSNQSQVGGTQPSCYLECMTEQVPLTTSPLPYRLTVDDFLRLDEAGAFEGYGKTELIRGTTKDTKYTKDGEKDLW